jgi:hypothetical protein
MPPCPKELKNVTQGRDITRLVRAGKMRHRLLGYPPLAGADEDRTLTQLRTLRSDLETRPNLGWAEERNSGKGTGGFGRTVDPIDTKKRGSTPIT